MAAHEGLHEPADALAPATITRHRAIVSLIEELEAVDWYDQRVDASGDSELRAVIAHNRDEEREHAAMLLEWLRRNDPRWDTVMRTYLFTEGSILEREAASEDGGSTGLDAGTRADAALGLGDLTGSPAR